MKAHILAVLAVTLAAGAASAQVTLYSQDRFYGRSFLVNQTVHNSTAQDSTIVPRRSSSSAEGGKFARIPSSGPVHRVAARTVPVAGGDGARQPRVLGSPCRRRALHVCAAAAAPAPYPYYQRSGERLFQANVVAVRAVTGPPEQRCWMEPQQVTAPSQPNIPGAIIGGVLGGVIGHQVGSGRGNDVATAVGAVGGAAVGANVNRGAGPTRRTCSAAGGSRQRSGLVLGRHLRLQGPDAPRAAVLRAGRHHHGERSGRASRLGTRIRVAGMHERMPASARDEPAVDGKRDDARQQEREREACPEEQ